MIICIKKGDLLSCLEGKPPMGISIRIGYSDFVVLPF